MSRDVSASLRRFLTDYVPSSHHKVSANLAARFMALKEFADEEIAAPANFGWAFACLTQVVWEKCALKHKTEMGMEPPRDSDWQVHRAVNKDLASLIDAAVGPAKEANRNRLRGYKV